MDNKPSLLGLFDSPTVSTGFANVGRNLCRRWLPHFEKIDIWGINYLGYPHEYPYRIYPGGYDDWNGPSRLSQFLNRLYSGEYTHLFIMCDTHQLCLLDFPNHLKKAIEDRKVHLTYYFPVDAPLEKEWMDVVAIADSAVTYTEYGRSQVRKVRPNIKINVLGHGADTNTFCPREDRMTCREEIFNTKGRWLTNDDVLLVNVNRNERRKAPHDCLQILKLLRYKYHVPAKLIMHMPNNSPSDHVNLELVGEQLGVPVDKYWRHSDKMFVKGNAKTSETDLNRLYNAADFVISTALGEGWGLSLSEGCAAGCRVLCPDNTSCGEIARTFEALGMAGQFTLLPLLPQGIAHMLDNSRVRYPVDVEKSAEIIANVIKAGPATGANTQNGRYILNDAVKTWLDWDRIAGEFLKLMGVK